jgi:hypothetical protein
MLYYDYVLTLPREIQFLWPPHNKQGWFTAACFLNRYLPLIGLMPVNASYFIKMNPKVRPFSSQPRLEGPDRTTVVSYGSLRVPTAANSSRPPSCEGLHTYHEWFVMVVQTHAGSASQKYSAHFPCFLTYTMELFVYSASTRCTAGVAAF